MSLPDQCEHSADVARLFSGTLLLDEEAWLASHLETCAVCQSTYEQLASDPGVAAARERSGDPLGTEAALQRVMGSLEATLQHTSSTDTSAEDLSLDFLAPSEDPEHLGRLDYYEVLEVVGHGGLGVVLKGYDTRLKRVVAIKVPLPQFAASAAARKRFAREATAAAAVSHDHVVTIHAVEPDRKPPYLVMEYVDGISLQQKLDGAGPLELKEILRIGMQAARGLAAAHEQGLVHRDIKPANILLENGVQRVKITDFGLARLVDDVGITQTGTVAGTPQYMSPEQARGEPVDYRSDLFSLGSVLYTMCTGRPAFRAEGALAVLKRVCEDAPRPIAEVNPEVPGWLCEIVDRLLEKHPEDRFQKAADVADLLAQHLAHLQQPAAAPMPARLAPTMARRARGAQRPDVSTRRRTPRWIAVVAAMVLFVPCVLGGVYGIRAIQLMIASDRGGSTTARLPENGQLNLTPVDSTGRTDADAANALRSNGSAGAPSNAEIADVLTDAVLVLNFSSETDNYQRDGEFFIKDYSGHGHDARLNESHTLDGAGRAGSGLRCTGGVGALLPARIIGDKAAFTLACWVYRMRNDRVDELYTESGRDDETPDVRVQIIPTDEGPRHNFVSGEVREVELPGGQQVKRGAWGSSGEASGAVEFQWAFLAWRFDAEIEDGKWWVTVNDETHEGAPQWRPYTDAGWTTLGEGFDGILDEFVAYPRAISDAELSVIYRAGLHGKSLRPAEVPVKQSADPSDTKLPLLVRLAVRGRRMPGSGLHPNWASDGREVLQVSHKSIIEALAPETGDVRTLLAADTLFSDAEIADAEWSPDGRFVAFGRRPTTAGTDEMRDEELWLLAMETGAAQKVADGGFPSWSADGKHLYYHARGAQQVRHLTVDNLSAVPIDVVPCSWFYPVVSPDEQLVAYGRDSRLNVVALTPGGEASVWQVPHNGNLGLVINWSPDSREIAVTGYDASAFRGLWLYDVERQSGVQVTDAPVRSVDWSPDGRRMVVSLQAPELQNWVVPLEPNRSTADSLRSFFNGEPLNTSRATEIARSSRVFSGTLAEGDLHVYALAFTSDGARAVTGHFGGKLAVWDVASGTTLHTPEGHTATIHATAISPDDRLLATGGEDSTIRIWDLQTGKQQLEIAANNGWVMSLAFRADGRELISAEWNLKDLPQSTIRVWDVETGTERGRIAGDLMSPTGLALAPDGTWAAVSDGGYGRVGLWDLDTRAARHFFGGFPTGPQCVALSPDGTLLLAGYNGRRQEEGKWNDPQNTVVRFWEVSTGRLIHEFEGHSGPILAVEFSSDGRYALSLASDQHDSAGQFVESSDHTVRIWDMKTRDEVPRFLVDRANVARWLPGRRSICTGVRIWDVPVESNRNAEQGQ